jgi:hypothetical protein
MTQDQFTRLLEGIGTEISQAAQIAVKVAGPIVDGIKANAPVDSGALQRSIEIRIENEREFYLQMLDYGFFQNYGVAASPDSSTANSNYRQLPPEEAVRFSLPPSGATYKFGVRQQDKRPWGAFYSGLNAKQFFTMAALANQISAAMQNEINNTL